MPSKKVEQITIQYLTGFEQGNITVLQPSGRSKIYTLTKEQMALVQQIKEEAENGIS